MQYVHGTDMRTEMGLHEGMERQLIITLDNDPAWVIIIIVQFWSVSEC